MKAVERALGKFMRADEDKTLDEGSVHCTRAMSSNLGCPKGVGGMVKTPGGSGVAGTEKLCCFDVVFSLACKGRRIAWGCIPNQHSIV